MIRGLVGSWKQLVFYDFDCNFTKVLFSIILEIEAAGYPVVGMVNDLGPTNIRICVCVCVCVCVYVARYREKSGREDGRNEV